MKYFFFCLPALFFIGCGNPETPIGQISGPWYYFDFSGFGENLSPGYFKVYSDSSWQKYAGIDTLLGTTYVAVLSSDSSLSFYTTDAELYAGYQLNGKTPILFNSPVPPLPAHWASDTTYGRVATFTLNGVFVEIADYFALVDTDSVATPVGNFSPAAHIFDETYLTASNGETGYAAQEIWLARGPGEIAYAGQGQAAVVFMYGYVNGMAWGGYGPVQSAAARHNLNPSFRSARLHNGPTRMRAGSNRMLSRSDAALLTGYSKGLLFFGTKRK